MIRIATVHWLTDRWIDVQLRYLDRFVGAPYRLYASLQGVHERHDNRFNIVTREPGSHAEKLNRLATRIVEDAASNDLIVFLDGDAFPVAPLAPRLERMIARRPLVAIRRDENLGDRQPHPAFCATTVAFWQTIGGDWSSGATWVNSVGRRVTDVGAALLVRLEEQGIEWEPLLRSNRRNVHPLWFEVYGDLIYHHGAGFREPHSRIEDDLTRVRSRLPGVRRLEWEFGHWRYRRSMRRAEGIGQRIYERLCHNESFAPELFGSP